MENSHENKYLRSQNNDPDPGYFHPRLCSVHGRSSLLEHNDEAEMNEDDMESVKYFLLDRGDVTRWTGWEKSKPEFQREYPEFIAALDQLTIAERTLRAVAKQMFEQFDEARYQAARSK